MIKVALYFFALLSALLVLIILPGCRLRLHLRAEPRWLCLRGDALLVWGLIKLRIDVAAAGFSPAVYLNGKKLRRKNKNKKGPLSMMDWAGVLGHGVRLVKSGAWGSVGIRGDAARSVVLTGALRELIRPMLLICTEDEWELEFVPALYGDRLCINLEGILAVNFTQIIYAAVKRIIYKNRERKQNYDTSC